jgi:hypothetical protein
MIADSAVRDYRTLVGYLECNFMEFRKTTGAKGIT